MRQTLDFLDDSRFAFACFTDSFKRYLKKAGLIEEYEAKKGSHGDGFE